MFVHTHISVCSYHLGFWLSALADRDDGLGDRQPMNDRGMAISLVALRWHRDRAGWKASWREGLAVALQATMTNAGCLTRDRCRRRVFRLGQKLCLLASPRQAGARAVSGLTADSGPMWIA
jgi:hypothetical protein